LHSVIDRPSLRASLEISFFPRIYIFPREISSFSLGKIGIPWESSVPKLPLRLFSKKVDPMNKIWR
jgi:hypothetical protein